ncbi:MAG: hypothetical protein AAGB31_13550 [Bdellovibrio sp.]
MKKAFILGMAAAVMSLSAVAAHAAPVAAKPAAKEVDATRKYQEEVRKAAFGGKTSAAGLDAQAAKKAQYKLTTELGISNKGMTVRAEYLNKLAEVVAAKKLALAKTTDSTERQAVEETGAVVGETIANGELVGAQKTLSTEQVAASDAIKALIDRSETILTYGKKERETHVQVLKEFNSLVASGRSNAEEALISAIIKVKNVDRQGAMEIIKKMKDCA